MIFISSGHSPPALRRRFYDEHSGGVTEIQEIFLNGRCLKRPPEL
jgi:hypothetical protein